MLVGPQLGMRSHFCLFEVEKRWSKDLLHIKLAEDVTFIKKAGESIDLDLVAIIEDLKLLRYPEILKLKRENENKNKRRKKPNEKNGCAISSNTHLYC